MHQHIVPLGEAQCTPSRFGIIQIIAPIIEGSIVSIIHWIVLRFVSCPPRKITAVIPWIKHKSATMRGKISRCKIHLFQITHRKSACACILFGFLGISLRQFLMTSRQTQNQYPCIQQWDDLVSMNGIHIEWVFSSQKQNLLILPTLCRFCAGLGSHSTDSRCWQSSGCVGGHSHAPRCAPCVPHCQATEFLHGAPPWPVTKPAPPAVSGHSSRR